MKKIAKKRWLEQEVMELRGIKGGLLIEGNLISVRQVHLLVHLLVLLRDNLWGVLLSSAIDVEDPI